MGKPAEQSVALDRAGILVFRETASLQPARQVNAVVRRQGVPGLTMKSTWDDLARSPRWRGVVSFIQNWVGPLDANQGIATHQLDAILHEKGLKLPTAIRDWYLLAAKWNQGGLNVWIPPQELTVGEGIVWILTDTEGINHWGVRVADVEVEDPPVVSYEKKNEDVS